MVQDGSGKCHAAFRGDTHASALRESFPDMRSGELFQAWFAVQEPFYFAYAAKLNTIHKYIREMAENICGISLRQNATSTVIYNVIYYKERTYIIQFLSFLVPAIF